jgi:antitoxin component YwqK of YwqJK toxin-antitoxin module
MNPNPINADNLEWDDDLTLLDGLPYSGAAFSLYADGSREMEMFYKDGFLDGVCRKWYANGNLKEEWYSNRGRTFGKHKKWYMDGKIKSIADCEHGVIMKNGTNLAI